MKVMASMEWAMLIKGFSIFISLVHFDEGMAAISAISVEGHQRNISVKLFRNQAIIGLGGDVI